MWNAWICEKFGNLLISGEECPESADRKLKERKDRQTIITENNNKKIVILARLLQKYSSIVTFLVFIHDVPADINLKITVGKNGFFDNDFLML